MKIKILLAIPQLTGGGAERVVSVWANELSERRYETYVLAFSKSEDEYYINPKVQVNYVVTTLKEYLSMSYIERIWAIRKCLKRIRPNYIISFLPAMQVWIMLASIGLNCKRIETIRINPWRISVTNKVQRMLWMMCYHCSYKIILQASDQKPFFSKADQEKCVVIPNPISDLYIKSYREALDEQPTTFIAVGRIDPQKNYEMMIDAFAKVCENHPELSLRIFGRGSDDYVAEINKHIARRHMESNIILMGRSPHMENEYQKSNIYLMTSDYEGLPNALMEGMVSQLICISTNCKTGPKDLIDDGVNGYLIPVGDANELTKTIEYVMEMDPHERQKVANAARNKILNYCSQKKSINSLCDLIK